MYLLVLKKCMNHKRLRTTVLKILCTVNAQITFSKNICLSKVIGMSPAYSCTPGVVISIILCILIVMSQVLRDVDSTNVLYDVRYRKMFGLRASVHGGCTTKASRLVVSIPSALQDMVGVTVISLESYKQFCMFIRRQHTQYVEFVMNGIGVKGKGKKV